MNPIKAGMVIVQRDEAELIEKNVHYHLGIGFNRIVIIDNCSSDPRTVAILKNMRSLPNVSVIFDSSHAFDQAALANRGIRHLLAYGDTDWIFPCDADEFFWFSEGLRSFLRRCDREGEHYGSIGWINNLPEMPPETWAHPCWYLRTTLFYRPFPERAWQHEGHFRKAFCRTHKGIEVVVGGHYYRSSANPAFFAPLAQSPAFVDEARAAIFHFEYRDAARQLLRKWILLASNQIVPDAPANAPWWEKRERMAALYQQYKESPNELHFDLVTRRRTLWGTDIPTQSIQRRRELAGEIDP